MRAHASVGSARQLTATPRTCRRLCSAMALLLVNLLSLAPVAGAGTDADTVDAQHGSAPPFVVGVRQDKLYFYPCSDCHSFMDPNNEVRELDVEEGHPAKLEHGDGQIWCLSCHDSTEYGRLRDLLSEPVDFDHGYQVCSGCHAQKYRDWTYGGHGKRYANWRGERRLYSCVECHNPHQPSIQPRAPKPPPSIRAGLEPMPPAMVEDVRSSGLREWEHTHAR